MAPKQVISQTFEKIKDQAGHTGKALVREPLNIVKSMLGEKGSGETGSTGGGKTATSQMTSKKRTKELERQQKLNKIRRQKQYLQKQEAERKRLDRERQNEEMEEEREEDAEEREEVIQLKKQKEKSRTLGGGGKKGPKGTGETIAKKF